MLMTLFGATFMTTSKSFFTTQWSGSGFVARLGGGLFVGCVANYTPASLTFLN
jgi:hypothetical protein